MFIVLTPEKTQHEEVKLLCNFASFEGVHLHIRKPQFSEVELVRYLGEIPKEVLGKSSLHHFHYLAEKFAISGVHFTTKEQNECEENLAQEIQKWKAKGKKVSASLHDLKCGKLLWDYAFLSPVFTSVSKKNYEGKGFCVANHPEKWIALGGVKTENIQTAKALGYGGIAVLGSVWQSENPQEAFEKLYEEYGKHFA